jgi:hypothetical protein
MHILNTILSYIGRVIAGVTLIIAFLLIFVVGTTLRVLGLLVFAARHLRYQARLDWKALRTELRRLDVEALRKGAQLDRPANGGIWPGCQHLPVHPKMPMPTARFKDAVYFEGVGWMCQGCAFKYGMSTRCEGEPATH